LIKKNTSALYAFLMYFLFTILILFLFNTLSFATVFDDQNCGQIIEPENSNGYIFDRNCTVAFIKAPKFLNATLRYEKEQILNICSKFTTKDYNETNGLKRIKIHSLYYFEYQSLIQEFQDSNLGSSVFFQKLPHSYSVAAIPRYETAMNLGGFPISVTSLKNAERVIRSYYDNREGLENINLDLDRYSLLPFNNILQNTWTLDTKSTCDRYFDPDLKSFEWERFEEHLLLKLSPSVINEYIYSKINERKRIKFVKELSFSYYKKDESN